MKDSGDYISREAFKQEVRKLSTHYLNEWDTLGVLAAADRIPAADVREVVYCRDCKFARFGPNWISCENFNGLCTNSLGLGDFCSRSEKKEES